jgi:cytochrome c oxidase accessory protein FixG
MTRDGEDGLGRDQVRVPSSEAPPIIGSMRADGSRRKVHPADVRGKWIVRRRVVFAALMAFYVLAPLVPVGGHPSLLLDFAHRRFFLVGHTFNAQDFWMVVLLGLTFTFGLLLVTAWRGRVWCGWACPQTVFLEGVYRPIERFFDGPRERRLLTAKQPLTVRRILRSTAKHLCFLLVSINIAHAAAAIFVSPRELLAMLREGPAQHWVAFLLTVGFAALLEFNFAWFREQFCVVMCPYGRMQSLLHDRDSITVSYDAGRGEPRGKLVKHASQNAPALGDCIDCRRCVVVCPTAIDIRNGLQMECLACTQCIDACDDVMVKIGRPTGLIGMLSLRGLGGQPTRRLRPRLAIYGALTLIAASALAAALWSRTPFEANILRPAGGNPFVVDGATIRNAFEIHLVNKAPEEGTFAIEVTGPVEATIAISPPVVTVGSFADLHVPVSVSIARRLLADPVELTVRVVERRSGAMKEQSVRFLSPPGLR